MKAGIVGGGISALMAAYRLLESGNNIRVEIFEKGGPIDERKCPILAKQTDRCQRCKSCAVMEGMAGAGAFSDGKYNITTEFGGWLQDIRDPEEVLRYENEADEILIRFGADTYRYMPDDNLKKLCLQHDLHMLQSECKHLGTDANFNTMKAMIAFMEQDDRLTVRTRCSVTDVTEESSGRKTIVYEESAGKAGSCQEEGFDVVIFAVGRSGSKFLEKWCRENGVKQINNQVDIGVRVELPAIIWEDIEKKIYEPKIHYRTRQYGDETRMFCFNGRGEVVTENTEGVLTVNGHAYKSEDKKTKNTNFAILSTIRFTEPFHSPIEYARHVASLANMISGGSVLVQRLGDLEIGRRTDAKRLRQGSVVPTLKGAVPGDLSLCMPKRQLDNVIETLHALNEIAPGTANYDTLLYGVECKYYSARPEADSTFAIKGKQGIYAIGDGAGFTRSLAQAAAQGLMVADSILSL